MEKLKKKEASKTIFAPYKTTLEYKKFGKEQKKKNSSFVGVPHCTLMDKVILSLKPATFKIYIHMLDYSNGLQEFQFPKSTYSKLVSNETFKNAKAELIEKGVIEEIGNGKNTRTENIYRFSDKWNYYNLPIKEKRKTKITENKFNYDKIHQKEN